MNSCNPLSYQVDDIQVRYSPRIVRTLQAVSYLVPPLRKTSPLSESQETQLESPATTSRTYARLLETFKFVLDVMGCTCDPPGRSEKFGERAYIMPGGEGWRSAVRVRMLHGVARRRAREKVRSDVDPEHEREADADVPISQEDMAAT